MDLPKRKQIRLPDYDYSAPGAYFVTICTHERPCILSDIAVGALLAKAVGYLKMNSSKRIHEKNLEFQLWQRGYYEHVIRNEKDHLEICEYIENNPARWAEDRYYQA